MHAIEYRHYCNGMEQSRVTVEENINNITQRMQTALDTQQQLLQTVTSRLGKRYANEKVFSRYIWYVITYCTMVTPSSCQLMQNCDRSTVKHGTQNIQNDCHQWLSDSFRLNIPNSLSAGAPPRTRWGSLQRSPKPSSWFKGPTSKGEGREGRRERKGRGKNGRERDGPSPFRKFLDPPLYSPRNTVDSHVPYQYNI